MKIVFSYFRKKNHAATRAYNNSWDWVQSGIKLETKHDIFPS